jgi:hypothetical protein
MICDHKNIMFHEILLYERKFFIIPREYHTYREGPGGPLLRGKKMVRVKDIPHATRWLMATRVLTRAVLALGREPADDLSAFRNELCAEIGDEIRQIADRYQMPREHAADLVQTLGTISVILFGPEFETRYIEGFPDEAVIRLTGCAMFREESAHGISPAHVNRVCRTYVASAIEALNPAFTISVTRARCSGDSFCEMVIERKKG